MSQDCTFPGQTCPNSAGTGPILGSAPPSGTIFGQRSMGRLHRSTKSSGSRCDAGTDAPPQGGRMGAGAPCAGDGLGAAGGRGRRCAVAGGGRWPLRRLARALLQVPAGGGFGRRAGRLRRGEIGRTCGGGERSLERSLCRIARQGLGKWPEVRGLGVCMVRLGVGLGCAYMSDFGVFGVFTNRGRERRQVVFVWGSRVRCRRSLTGFSRWAALAAGSSESPHGSQPEHLPVFWLRFWRWI